MSKMFMLVAGLLIAHAAAEAQPVRFQHSQRVRVREVERIVTLSGGGPALVESIDYPPATTDPGPDHPGGGCFWLATGSIETGDVDAVSVTLPFAAASVIVDIDFAAATGDSMLLVLVGAGTTVFNMNDGNSADDSLCGLGVGSDPVGSEQDSAAKLLDTPAGAVIEIRITGNGDFSFEGAHGETFAYDIWVHAVSEDTGCTADDDCDDGVFCNGAEVCDATSGCISGVPPDCDDGVDCTADLCDQVTDACVNDPDDGSCDDGVFCNGDEVCGSVSGCVAGTEPDCDDGIMCTIDRCDANTDDCVHEADDAACDDSLFCNGTEACNIASGCEPGDSPCPTGTICAEEAQACIGLFLDIKPGSCANPLNLKSRDVVPIALLTDGESISETIDLSSLRLGRLDGVGTPVAPHEGPNGPHTVLEDVGTPALDGPCGCHGDEADGVLDVLMKFKMQALVTQLELGEDTLPESLELELTGTFSDGSTFSVIDCFRIVPPKADRRGHR